MAIFFNILLCQRTGLHLFSLSAKFWNRSKQQRKEASQLVGTLGNIAGIKAWVFFVEENDQIRVRFRSKGVVINTIAKKYHGGGHPLAAGASIYDWAVADEILRDLEEVCKASS